MRFVPLLAAGATLVARSLSAEPYEVPPEEEPSASLSAAQLAGEYFHIDAPVHSDGLMHHYLVDSRFGIFPAYGRGALAVRLREVTALTSIAKTSDADVALQSVGRSLRANASAAVDLAKNPVGAVTGIPKGIGHLFGGYRAKAEELSANAHKSGPSDSQQPRTSVINRGTEQAQQYAARYLGITAAQMRWYQTLGVDPYTTNEVLRSAVKHLAKVDATTSLGMRFVPVPGIPYAGEVGRALHTIYTEDPAVLRKRRREALAACGLAVDEIERFESAALLSPTRQAVLADAANTLQGVAGRAELFRHALAVTSDEEIEVFLHSTALLVRFHGQQPVTRIVAGLRLPAGQVADGRVFVFGAFDAVYWTEQVAGYERSLEESLPPDAAGRELWLAGSVSERARSELQQRGWRVHDRVDEMTVAEAPRP
jgi:hypothetical protein